MKFRYLLDFELDPKKMACRKALYWLERDFQFSFSFEEHEIICELHESVDIDQFSSLFVHRYNDFLLRGELRSKTDPLRELILAKMLFPGNINIPENDLRDPLDIFNE